MSCGFNVLLRWLQWPENMSYLQTNWYWHSYGMELWQYFQYRGHLQYLFPLQHKYNNDEKAIIKNQNQQYMYVFYYMYLLQRFKIMLHICMKLYQCLVMCAAMFIFANPYFCWEWHLYMRKIWQDWTQNTKQTRLDWFEKNTLVANIHIRELLFLTSNPLYLISQCSAKTESPCVMIIIEMMASYKGVI